MGDVVEVKATCKTEGESSTMTISAAVLDEARFAAHYNALNAATMELTEFSNTEVVGTIDCNRDGLLYTSIPQDGNWYATVDGKPVQTVLIGNAMLGLNLSQGTHTVTFFYKNTAFFIGCAISIACLVVFLGCYWLCYQPTFKKKKKGKYAR
jgi:uncharacterized membrane protein YfhO